MENSLPSGTNKSMLAKVFDEFKQVKCPEPPENDDLYDLYSELMEYDGHVAGLVSSFLNGNHISRALVFRNEKLVEMITSFPEDSDELHPIKHYFYKLDEMVQMLIVLV
jgi:hypothetical protein